MKIKRTKQLRYDELIKYILDNSIAKGHYFCHTQAAFVDVIEGVIYSSYGYTADDFFKVDFEEEITRGTVFDLLLPVYRHTPDDGEPQLMAGTIADASIDDWMEGEDEGEDGYFETKYIYHLDQDCKQTLVWSAEHGIPEDGVLEVE